MSVEEVEKRPNLVGHLAREKCRRARSIDPSTSSASKYTCKPSSSTVNRHLTATLRRSVAVD